MKLSDGHKLRFTDVFWTLGHGSWKSDNTEQNTVERGETHQHQGGGTVGKRMDEGSNAERRQRENPGTKVQWNKNLKLGWRESG